MAKIFGIDKNDQDVEMGEIKLSLMKDQLDIQLDIEVLKRAISEVDESRTLIYCYTKEVPE